MIPAQCEPDSTWLKERLCLRDPRSECADILRVLRSYLTDQILNDPNQNDLAGDFFISQRTLCRRLNKAGLSYRSVVNDVRRDMAVTLLRETELPIAEVSRRLGYANASNFTKAFKLWTGTRPREYRRAVVEGLRY